MKKKNVFILVMCLMTTLLCFGCGSKDLEPAKIIRDDARTGGSLSFVYDKNQCTVYVGGEDEVVQYSIENEAKGLAEGCRVGIKVVAPDEVLDLSTSTLEMNGVNYSSGEFLESINGQKQRFFNLYPIVSKDSNKIKFSIVWQDGTNKQEYKIVVVEGTKFMQKDGSVDNSSNK